MSGSTVTLATASGQSFTARLATPEKAGGPGIVILQEIFGINAFVREAADRYAALGYTVIAPDLFWRQEPGVQLDPGSDEDRNRAMAFMKGLNETAAIEDALTAATYLREALGCASVGTIGYCLGGKLAYLMAKDASIGAAVAYYGVAIQSVLSEASNLTAPLLLHIAGDDHLCPPEAQEQIIGALEPAGVEIIVHPGVPHGFARYNSSVYDAEAAERADNATAAFLTKHLL